MMNKKELLQSNISSGAADCTAKSAQCSSEFRGCDYAELCGTVRNFGSFAGFPVYVGTVYGLLRAWHRRHHAVFPVLWKKGLSGHSGGGGNRTSVFHSCRPCVCTACILFPDAGHDRVYE